MKDRENNEQIFFGEGQSLLVKDTAVAPSERTYHEELEIKLCYEGEMFLSVGGQVLCQRVGEISIVNPYETHFNIPSGEARYYLLMVGFDLLEEIGLLRQSIIGAKQFKHIVKDERIADIIRHIVWENAEERPYRNEAIKGALTQMLALLMRSWTKEKEEGQDFSQRAAKRLIEPALRRIHTDYARKITLEELAKECYISKSHLCRSFKEMLGKTPFEYVMDYRISIAELLLKRTEKTCHEIGRSCGFEDESYFTRCYRRLKGKTPGEARRAFKDCEGELA